MSESRVTLSVCVDCLGWLEFGPTDPYWEFSEGYSGPELLEPVEPRYYWISVLSEREPHYSSAPCGGCGSGLAGDRATVALERREQ